MTERGLPIVDGAPACPFVAFEDERDERATSPDHRHRCYAENPPAPRALAHQEAYCLSSAFPVCPTFQDWARREAARARPGAAATEDGADLPPLVADRPPRRSGQKTWAAPPPWLRGSGGAQAGGEAGAQAGAAAAGAAGAGAAGAGTAGAAASAGGASGDVPPRGGPGGGGDAGGLAGSYADRMASQEASAGRQPGGGVWDEREDWDEESEQDVEDDRQGAMAGAAMGAAAAAAAAAAAREQGRQSSGPYPPDAYAGGSPASSEASMEDLPPRRRGRERVDAGRDDPRSHDAYAPAWERPRRLEAYPTLRSRRLSGAFLPPLLIGVAAVLLAGAALFFLPSLLGFGGPQAGGLPSASAAPSAVPSQSVAPTIQPAPTPFIYTVKSGDTMSRIANRFHVSLADLLAANVDTIKNPDKLQIGDQVIIPTPVPSELPAAS